MEGYVKLHRKILCWEWHDDPHTLSVFIHLLLMANHEPGRWHGISINRGQVLTSLSKLANTCGISLQNLRTCLSRLKSTGEITYRPTRKYSILTICKYDDYQSQPTSDQHTDQHANQHTANTQSTINKNDKNNKKRKNNINNKEVISQPMTDEELAFTAGMKENFPNVMGMAKPLTFAQWAKSIDVFGQSLCKDKLQAMENKPDLRTKYVSAYITLTNWCRRNERLNK